MLGAVAARGDWDVVGVAAAHRHPPAPSVAPTVPVCHLALGRRVLYEAWHRFRRPLIQRRTGPVDIVHATGGAIPPPGDAALVVTIHDLAPLTRPEWFTPHGVRFMSRAFELARAEADMVIVPSEATARDCRDRGVGDDRLRVVPWGVEPRLMTDSARAEVRARYRLPGEFALWVGTAEPRKNLDGLVNAVARVETALPLVLAGPRGWNLELDDLLDRAPSTVRHLGEVAEADLGVLYDLATVFVYPSLMEGYGMPVLEAMAQGTAVVTSAGTATEEVVGPAAVLVDPGDVDALAEAIDRVVGDEALRRSLAAAGRARAASLTWPKTGAGTVAAYADALG